MTSIEEHYAEASALLQERTDFELMTAYERTKALMEILSRKGLDAPNWAVTRALIGKGSAGDINRAKRDFRKELGVQLARMRGAKGLPDEVSDKCSELWLLAVEKASSLFDDQVKRMSVDLECAASAQMEAETQRDEARARVAALEGERTGLQSSLQSLQALVHAERDAKEHAEQMFNAAQVELGAQLEQTKAALAQAQQETAKALTRFEGLENRFQVEIDRARRELASERERMGAERVKEQATFATSKNRAAIQMDVERSKRRDAETKLAASAAEVAELRTQLAHAQETIRTALRNRVSAVPKTKMPAEQKQRKVTKKR